jgi:hypothetical protein
MSGPAATPIGADEAPRGKRYFESGPWLIGFGHGLRSELWAQEMVEQCAGRGVGCDLAAIDEIDRSKLAYYTALAMVLPTSGVGERSPSLIRLAELIREYRTRRPLGLDALISGCRRWFEVGVIQVFDGTANTVRVSIEPLAKAICRYHHVCPDQPLTPFACYEDLGRSARPEPAETNSNHRGAALEKIRTGLAQWGIAWSLHEIREILAFIEGMRGLWEGRAFFDLRRPVPGDERNRFAFLLDLPDFVPAEDICPHKKWMEGGQRVVTRVLDDLGKAFPAVRRPPGREGKKGKQADFQDLYRRLRAAEGLLSAGGPAGRFTPG